MPTSPTPIAALPTPPSTANPAGFDSAADAFLGALPTFRTETNTVAADVYDNAVEAAGSADAAAGSASAASTHATNAGNSASAAAASALAAANTVATIPEGSIDDSATALTKVWSSSKVSTTMQPLLVSGTTIKTINGVSLLGSGDVSLGTSVGDTLTTNRALPSPAWLPCDGSVYLQSSYAALYSELGLIVSTFGTKLTNPAPLPPTNALACSWDSTDTYLAVACQNVNPRMAWYQRSGTTLHKLSDPTSLPFGNVYDCAWGGSGGAYLAMATDSSSTYPYIVVYSRSGTTLTKLPDPATGPTGVAYGCSWDSTGTYLAVAHAASPGLTVYRRSGGTLTKLTNPASLPVGSGRSCAWDPSGTYLAVGETHGNFMVWYQRSGTTLTKLSDPAVLPTGVCKSCAWDSTGTYLAFTHATAPFLTVYERSGTTLTKLADPATLPTTSNATYGKCSWGAAGNVLAITTDTSPYIRVYSRSGRSLVEIPAPSTLPAGIGNGCAVTSTGQYVAVGHCTTPFITVYQTYTFDPATQFQVPVTQNTNLSTYIRATA